MSGFLYRTTLVLTASIVPLTTANAQESRTSAPYLRRAADADARAPIVIAKPRADAVILRSEQPADVVQSLSVKRQLSLANIKSSPVQSLGGATINFKPMLDNPRAPFNVAAKLRIMPQVAEVLADETTAYEIDQGVIVRSAISYRLKPGACSDFLRLAALSTTGVQCASPVSDTAFANKKDAHYVADPAKRSQALADAKAKREAMRQDIAADIADLRSAFTDRARYVELTNQLGAAEVSRLQGLADEQLTLELINSAENTVEQLFYIPKQERTNLQVLTGFQPRVATSRQTLAPEGTGEKQPPKIGKVAPAEETTLNLKPRIFLTGFTLGRGYEWRQRIEKSIKWCVVGCKKTYHAEIYAGFGLGFGLRFPLQVSGLYQYKKDKNGESASLTPNFVPINGSEADYADAGLPALQVFKGKELVAEAQAYAGIGFKLPVVGSGGSPEVKLGQDYTDGLPAPYTGGQFQPPYPGQSDLKPLTKVFEDADLLLGVGNYGVVGAQILPALKAELKSDSLRFTLRDNVTGKATVLTSTGQTVPLGVNPADKSSNFSIADPVYNLYFLATPGLTGRIFIDLSVWSNHWDWPVWFPQLAVKLPPNGVDFACHEGTVCSRNYVYSPTRQDEGVGPANPTEAELASWAIGFDNKWLPQCPDKKCELAIKIVRQGTIYNNTKLGEEKAAFVKAGKTDEAQATNLKIFKGYLNANNEAAGVIEEAKKRVVKRGK
jgi:hypothetical protein